ncbi:MAG: ATP-binding protein [Beijerinckiaceae bacterium]
MSVASTWSYLRDLPTGNLSGHARLRLHRNARLVAAALVLAAFPAMALVSEAPLAVIASLMLFGILPAAVAVDVRRPAKLDRAVILNLVIIGAVLTGGVIRGLPVVSATSLLALMTIEAMLVVGRRQRVTVIGLALLAAIVMAGSSIAALGKIEATTLEHSMVWTVTLAAALVISNTMMLMHGILGGLAAATRKMREQTIQSIEVEQMVSESVVAIDRNGSVIRVSNNTDRVLSLAPDALKGRGLAELVLVADRPLLLSAISQAMHKSKDKPATKQTMFRLRLRTSALEQRPAYRWVEFCVSPAQTSNCVTATLRDIDEQVTEEERMVAAALEAETAKKARGAFLSTVNHELRTPLNAIVGFSEILSNPQTMPATPERVKEYATLINGAGQDLLRMVTAMIDITKLDSGVYDFDPELTELQPMLEALAISFSDSAESKEAKVVVHATDATISGEVDIRALRCVVQQLLSNAAKFGRPKGVIDLHLKQEPEWITISVTDKGQGIAKDKLQQLGQSFVRLNDTLDREHGGIGLGLSLARGLMSLHGGLISIESTQGKGTTVTLSLPRPDVRPDQLANVHTLTPAATKAATLPSDTVPERRRA